MNRYDRLYTVRARPKDYKLRMCYHQYDCRFGENCKFAHGQTELELWQGRASLKCRHMHFSCAACVFMRVRACMCVQFACEVTRCFSHLQSNKAQQALT